MEKQLSPEKKKPTDLLYRIVLILFGAFAIAFVARTFLKNITTRDDEEIALFATIFLIAGVYFGRFISLLLVNKNREVPLWPLILLPIIMVFCAFLCVFFGSNFLNHPAALNALFFAISLFVFFVSFGMFIKLLRMKMNKQVAEAQTTATHSQSELQLLQSQLSPHFLFNTLNNMYGISITNHEKIPPLLLKLSDLLRYSVYDAKEILVPLKDELAYINNYIDFEKIRIGERLDLKTDLENITDKNIKIAPMLLIIFVENSFKHSKNTNDQKIYIEIGLKIWSNSILFSIKNSHNKRVNESILTDRHSGFGLSNVRKRLDLLYPDGYDLKMENAEYLYSVMLRLNVR